VRWIGGRSRPSRLRKTVQWYLGNRAWWERVQSGQYRGERLGLAASG
jgi:dTDP-glucose 4,6-dehydratase